MFKVRSTYAQNADKYTSSSEGRSSLVVWSQFYHDFEICRSVSWGLRKDLTILDALLSVWSAQASKGNETWHVFDRCTPWNSVGLVQLRIKKWPKPKKDAKNYEDIPWKDRSGNGTRHYAETLRPSQRNERREVAFLLWIDSHIDELVE